MRHDGKPSCGAPKRPEWERFLADLYKRGLTGEGLDMFCVDGGSGLIAALPMVYDKIPVQRYSNPSRPDTKLLTSPLSLANGTGYRSFRAMRSARMGPQETELERTVRYVEHAREIIDAQHERIERFRAIGASTALAEEMLTESLEVQARLEATELSLMAAAEVPAENRRRR